MLAKVSVSSFACCMAQRPYYRALLTDGRRSSCDIPGPEKHVMQVEAALRQAEIVRWLSSNPAQQTEAPGRDPSALLHRLQLGQANAPVSAGQQVGFVACIWHLHSPRPVSQLSWGHVFRGVAQSFQQCLGSSECLHTEPGCSDIWPESCLVSLHTVPPRHAEQHCRCTRGL